MTIKVIVTAVLTLMNAWDSHRIPGPQGGIPNVLALHRNVTVLLISSVPSRPHLVTVLTSVNACNSHRIAGPQGGIVNVLALHTNVAVLPISSVPSIPHLVAVHEYNGHRLSQTAAYGSDHHPELQIICKNDFFDQFPSMANLFESVLHSNGFILRECIHCFICITKSLLMLLE